MSDKVWIRTSASGDVTVWRDLPAVPGGYTRTKHENRDGELVVTQFDSRGSVTSTYIEVEVWG